MSSRRAPRSWPRHLPYLILLVIGTAFFIGQSLPHHRALGTGYDLGIYNQVVWNLAHGRSFATTLVYETGGWYDHFEPVLALLAPLYWLFPDVRVLLVVQSVALGLGSLPIYLFAYRQLVHRASVLLPFLLAAAYLAFPPLHHANLNDFHEVALIPPLLGFALYGLLRGLRRTTFIFLILCLLVKEDFGITALAFGLYILVLKPRGFRRADGALWSALVITWILLVLWVLYPAVTHGMPYPFVERRYPWLGNTPQEALNTLLLRPWVVLPHLLEQPKLLFVLRLLGPLLFIPLLGWPVIALALPVLIYLMLSDYQPQWSVSSYYNPPLVPFLFFATIVAIQNVQRWGARFGLRAQPVANLLVAAIVVGVGIAYLRGAPGPGGGAFDRATFSPDARTQAAHAIMARVPPDASLSTEWPLIPHLSQRQAIYTLLARPSKPPQYLLEELRPISEGAPVFPFAAADGWPPVYHEYSPTVTIEPFRLSTLARSLTLEPLAEPQPSPQPLSLAAYAWLDGAAVATPPTVPPGAAARLMLAWHRTGTLDRRYVFFVHVLDPAQIDPNTGAPRIITQSGHEAGDGRFPTTFWETWTNPRIVLDPQVLEVPLDTPPGQYEVWAGVYDKETLQRLEIGGPGQTLRQVGTLEVSAP